MENLKNFIEKRIEVKEKEKNDAERTLENRISIGGQLTAFKQVLNYINTHKFEDNSKLLILANGENL